MPTSHPTPNDIERGQRFKEARLNGKRTKGLSQRAAAAVVGVDKTTLVRWENGTRAPRPDQLALARVAYGCDAEWLMTGRGENEAVQAARPRNGEWLRFEQWLRTQPEAQLAEPWMLDTLQSMTFPPTHRPSIETYRRVLLVLVASRPKSERAPRMAASG
jgi:transcriptional regulator with XRE-family HTH domain